MLIPTQFPDSYYEFFHPIPEEEFLESNTISFIPIRRSNPGRFGLTEFSFLLDDKAEDLTREMAHTKLNPEIVKILADEGKMNLSLEDFETLEGYEEFRIINCGLLPYSQIMEYTMELSLTDAERQDAKRLEWLVFKCIGVSDDLWSWPKEAQAYKKGKRVMNAILLAMKLKNLTAYQAVVFIKKRVVQFQQELLVMRDEFLSALVVSGDMR
ncbi:hypothetical protein G7Y89_g10613 [Cudoniella acicularis]|uniref:Uncharacterized protein n=1 Tax=Cudoniella acicularis TaxID=354080 RepID=A0A8H4W0S4_9HELO|nr:hypothetical protein G7Y89_g10613 [Cudoniella acicularis]